jgi:hypothetical protein
MERVMGSYAIQLWLQSIWNMMLGLGHSQNKDLHGHRAATKGKIEVEYKYGLLVFFLIIFIGICFHILVM